jgi:Uma2 family endonuclease
MAAQTLPLSLEEFHKRYDGAKPAYEYWYGEAIQKSMPTVPHGLVQFIIMTLLKNAGWNTVPEVRLKVVPDAEPVPDVIAVRGKFKGRYPAVAPDLCVEILSPGDTLSKTLKKAKIYLSWGSQCVWIVDPEKRTAWTVSPDAPEPTWISPEGTLSIAGTAVALSALFAEVDKSLESSETEE